MLIDAKTIEGFEIHATDGDIGKVHDVLFDDDQWTVRYLVVSTGSWINRERVLLSPECVTGVDSDERKLSVSLRRQQVEDSPDVSSDIPVSRQQEERLRSYYAWPVYWGGAGLGDTMGGGLTPAVAPGAPMLMMPRPVDETLSGSVDASAPPPSQETEPAGDPHLRSAREVRDYEIAATDGDIGHVEDLVIDVRAWSVHRLVVDTKNWWPGRKVVVSPRQIQRVRWSDHSVRVNLTRDEIKHAPEFATERAA